MKVKILYNYFRRKIKIILTLSKGRRNKSSTSDNNSDLGDSNRCVLIP